MSVLCRCTPNSLKAKRLTLGFTVRSSSGDVASVTTQDSGRAVSKSAGSACITVLSDGPASQRLHLGHLTLLNVFRISANLLCYGLVSREVGINDSGSGVECWFYNATCASDVESIKPHGVIASLGQIDLGVFGECELFRVKLLKVNGGAIEVGNICCTCFEDPMAVRCFACIIGDGMNLISASRQHYNLCVLSSIGGRRI